MYHFISGMPRAGSSLLSAILRQNPLFYASISGPVGRMITDMLTSMGPDNEAHSFIHDAQRQRVLRSIFDAYYADQFEGGIETVFDTNRRWTASAAALDELFPDSKIICCVCSPADACDSFERLWRRNALVPSVIYGGFANTTVQERVKAIMGSTGVVGFAYQALKDAWYGPHRNKLLIVEYDALAARPTSIMAQLHATLHLPPFEYDFKNIKPIPGVKEFDRELGTPGLHDVKSEVVWEKRVSVLPPDIYNSLPKPFWRVKEAATTPG